MTEQVKRRNDILEAIRTLGPIKNKELVDLIGCSHGTISNDLSVLRTNYEIKSSMKGYYIPKKDDEKVSMKNSEGYPDPTAALAINGLAEKMMTNSFDTKKEQLEIADGYIIHLQDLGVAIDAAVYYVIIDSLGPYIYCCPIKDKLNYKESYSYKIRITDSYWINPNLLTTFNLKSTEVRNASIGKEGLAKVSNKVLDRIKEELPLNFNSGKESEACKDDLETALLKQKADIYERAFYAVCGKEKNNVR